MDKKISKYFSELAKKSHKKSPRSRKFYQAMVAKRWKKVIPKRRSKRACDEHAEVID